MNVNDYASQWDNGAKPTMTAQEIADAFAGKDYNTPGFGNASISDPAQAAAELARVKQFDPNATMETLTGTNYSNESGTGTRPDQYVVHYDQSKDPNFKTITNPDVLALQRAALTSAKYNESPTAFDPTNLGQHGFNTAWLADPSKVYKDEGTGKTYTTAGNYHTEYNDPGSKLDQFMEKAIPAVAIGVMTGGLGLPALAAGAVGGLANAGFSALQGNKFDPKATLLNMATGALGTGVSGALGGGITGNIAGGLSKYGANALINGQNPTLQGAGGIVASALAKNFNPVSFLSPGS